MFGRNWYQRLGICALLAVLLLASNSVLAGNDPDEGDIVTTDPISAPDKPVCSPE